MILFHDHSLYLPHSCLFLSQPRAVIVHRQVRAFAQHVFRQALANLDEGTVILVLEAAGKPGAHRLGAELPQPADPGSIHIIFFQPGTRTHLLQVGGRWRVYYPGVCPWRLDRRSD